MSRVPRIRFKGFEEDWEQRKFSELYELVNEKNDGSYGKDSNITVATMQFKSNIQISKNEYLNTYNIFKKGYIAFEGHKSKEFRFGRFVENDIGDGIVSHIFIVFRPIMEFDINFWKYAINNEVIMQSILSRATKASTMMNDLVVKDFLKEIFFLPSLGEQACIGKTLKSIDHLITLHQRKLEKLKIIKKSLLENLFPQNGEKTPKIRFSGFTEDWEQRKLGECFTERIDSMPNGELISVTINDGIKKFSELGRHDNSNEDKSKYKKVCIGDIAYNSMRMWQGASGYSPYNGIVSPAYTVLVANEDVNSKCIAYQFKLPRMIHAFQINSQGITSDNWNLKFPTLSDISIYISRSIDEQGKIASLLESLDNLITLHQSKLDKLQKIKKSMLESMFV